MIRTIRAPLRSRAPTLWQLGSAKADAFDFRCQTVFAPRLNVEARRGQVLGATGGNFWARSHVPLSSLATGYRLILVQFWRDPILDAPKLDNGTWGPNYFCKSTGGCPGRNNKAEDTPGATAVRPGETRRGAYLRLTAYFIVSSF